MGESVDSSLMTEGTEIREGVGHADGSSLVIGLRAGVQRFGYLRLWSQDYKGAGGEGGRTRRAKSGIPKGAVYRKLSG